VVRPEHDSPNRLISTGCIQPSGERIPRARKEPPEKLSRHSESLRAGVPPGTRGLIHPIIDGQVTSYFEWWRGLYRADPVPAPCTASVSSTRIHMERRRVVFVRLGLRHPPGAMAGGVECVCCLLRMAEPVMS